MASGAIKKYMNGTASGRGWLQWAGTENNAESFIGNIFYRKIGPIVQIKFNAIYPKTEITASFFAVGALPDSWAKPDSTGPITGHIIFPTRISLNSGAENYIGTGIVFSNTTGIRIYRPVELASLTTTTGLFGSVMYFAAS